MEEQTFNPDDEVLTLKLYRRDPNCIEYAFVVDTKFDNDDPKHLEQLTVIHDIIQRYITNAEKALIHKALTTDRSMRAAQKKFVSEMETTGEPN